MKIHVNALCILSGRPGEPCACAVAKALAAAGYTSPAVDQQEISFLPLDGGEVLHPAPAEVGAFVQSYDTGQQVAPFTFDFPYCRWCGVAEADCLCSHGIPHEKTAEVVTCEN